MGVLCGHCPWVRRLLPGGPDAGGCNYFKNFQRFHDFINPTSGYYPTALQVRALVKAKIPADKIAVIIGGDSILHGSGQGSKQLWSEHLERELGEPFRVLNLAFPGGGPNEHGMLAAELLRSNGQPVIYVCDSNIARFCATVDYTSDTYRYLFHDARAHGLLAHFLERDQALAKLDEHEASRTYDELRYRAWANSYLGFNDFWHILGYRFSFTVWSPRLQGTHYAAFGPRRKCLEPEMVNPDPSVEKRNANPHYGENLEAMRNCTARSMIWIGTRSSPTSGRSLVRTCVPGP